MKTVSHESLAQRSSVPSLPWAGYPDCLRLMKKTGSRLCLSVWTPDWTLGSHHECVAMPEIYEQRYGIPDVLSEDKALQISNTSLIPPRKAQQSLNTSRIPRKVIFSIRRRFPYVLFGWRLGWCLRCRRGWNLVNLVNDQVLRAFLDLLQLISWDSLLKDVTCSLSS